MGYQIICNSVNSSPHVDVEMKLKCRSCLKERLMWQLLHNANFYYKITMFSSFELEKYLTRNSGLCIEGDDDEYFIIRIR